MAQLLLPGTLNWTLLPRIKILTAYDLFLALFANRTNEFTFSVALFVTVECQVSFSCKSHLPHQPLWRSKTVLVSVSRNARSRAQMPGCAAQMRGSLG